MLELLAILLAPAVVDHGVFRITVQGRPAGEEKFEIVSTPDGLETRTDGSLKLGSLEIASKGTLKTDPAGRPQSGALEITSSGKTSRLTLRRNAGKLELTAESPGQSPRVLSESQPVDLFLGNNVFAQATPLCRLAGSSEKTFTMFPGAPLKLGPGRPQSFTRTLPVPGEISLTSIVAEVANSARMELACDGSRLVALRVPMAGVTAARVGW